MEAIVVLETTAVLLAGFGWAAFLYTLKLREAERMFAPEVAGVSPRRAP